MNIGEIKLGKRCFSYYFSVILTVCEQYINISYKLMFKMKLYAV